MNDRYSNLCKEFGVYLKKRGRQPSTIQSYCYDILEFLSYLQKHKITPQRLELILLKNYQDFLSSNANKTNSIRRKIISIRQFFRYISNHKETSSSPFENSTIPQRYENPLQLLTQKTIQTLIAISSTHAHEIKRLRDPAILSLLAYEGIKVSEAISLRWTDFLYLKNLGSLKISGPKERIIHLSKISTDHIRSYQKTINKKLKTSTNYNNNKMLIGFKGKNKLTPLPTLTRHGLKFLLYEIGEKARIPHLNTESLRHFSIFRMLKLQKTPQEIQEHLGLKRMGNIIKHLQKLRKETNEQPK